MAEYLIASSPPWRNGTVLQYRSAWYARTGRLRLQRAEHADAADRQQVAERQRPQCAELANAPPALSTRISVAKACASLMGKMGALLAEKSSRVDRRTHEAGGHFHGERERPHVADRVRPDLPGRVREADGGRIGARLREEAAGEPRGQARVAHDLPHVEHLEHRACADALRVRAALERPVLGAPRTVPAG